MKNEYRSPDFLNQRYQEFDQRYDLREQFQRILRLMESHQEKLESILILKKKDIGEIEKLLKEIKEFKIWSWKEADMDDGFYDTIKEFDERAFMLIHSD